MTIKATLVHLLLLTIVSLVSTLAQSTETTFSDFHQFAADGIELDGRFFDVNISVSRDSKVWFRYAADDSDQVRYFMENDTLIVRSDSRTSIGSISVIANGSSSSILVINGEVIVSDSTGKISLNSGKQAPTIDIAVPVGTYVRVTNAFGMLSIDDIQAPFDYSGSGKVQVGLITDATISLRGNGAITVDGLSGDLNATLNGNSEIQIGDSNADRVKVATSGNTQLSLKGQVEKLSVNASGNSRVQIGKVSRKPWVRMRGNAKVTVNHPAS